MSLNKNKKGFVLSDAIIGMAVSLLIGASLIGLLIMLNNITNQQQERVEAYNLADRVINEVQSVKNIENLLGETKNFVYDNLGVGQVLQCNMRLNVENIEEEDTINSNQVLGDYEVCVIIEPHNLVITDSDSNDDSVLKSIKVIVQWSDINGSKKNVEMVGFKVDDYK